MEARARAAVARLQELSQQARRADGRRAPAEHVARRPSTRPRRSAAPCCSPSARPTRPSPRRRPRPTGARSPPAARQARRQARRGGPRRGAAGPASPSGCRSRARSRRCWPGATSSSPTSTTSSSTSSPSGSASPRSPAELTALVQRVPAGLGDMRRPLLSAAAEPTTPSRCCRSVPSTTDPPSVGTVRRRRRRRGRSGRRAGRDHQRPPSTERRRRRATPADCQPRPSGDHAPVVDRAGASAPLSRVTAARAPADAAEPHGVPPGRRRSRTSPASRTAILERWERDGRSSSRSPSARTRGPTSSCSTTGRRSPTGCRTTGTC